MSMAATISSVPWRPWSKEIRQGHGYFSHARHRVAGIHAIYRARSSVKIVRFIDTFWRPVVASDAHLM
jgi:hypothetical protein